MNANRRHRLEHVLDELRMIAEEERTAFDNAPEGLADTERYQKIEENADTLDEAIQDLGTLLE